MILDLDDSDEVMKKEQQNDIAEGVKKILLPRADDNLNRDK